MEIKEIKAQLSIKTVLQRYGLQLDKHDRLCTTGHMAEVAMLATSVRRTRLTPVASLPRHCYLLTS